MSSGNPTRSTKSCFPAVVLLFLFKSCCLFSFAQFACFAVVALHVSRGLLCCSLAVRMPRYLRAPAPRRSHDQDDVDGMNRYPLLSFTHAKLEYSLSVVSCAAAKNKNDLALCSNHFCAVLWAVQCEGWEDHCGQTPDAQTNSPSPAPVHLGTFIQCTVSKTTATKRGTKTCCASTYM